MGFLEQLQKAIGLTPKCRAHRERIPDEDAAPDFSACPVDFIHWAEWEAFRITQLCDREQELALRLFEAQCAGFDELPQVTKEQALELAKRKPVDVFNPTNVIPEGCPIVLADRDNPGMWIARGCAELEGHGNTQLEAVIDLVANQTKEDQVVTGPVSNIPERACKGNDRLYQRYGVLGQIEDLERRRYEAKRIWTGFYRAVFQLDRNVFGVALSDEEMDCARKALPICGCRLCTDNPTHTEPIQSPEEPQPESEQLVMI